MLSTRWISYEEILKLKTVESMVEVYYNSGQFQYTLNWLTGFWEDAFSFYEDLGRFYERKGYEELSHSRIRRYEILLENYSKTLHIEAKTLLEMMTKDLLPSLLTYEEQVAEAGAKKKAFSASISTIREEELLDKLTSLYEQISKHSEELGAMVATAEGMEDSLASAEYYQSQILPKMDEVRICADEAESLIPDDLLPYPTYSQLLFSI